MRHLLFPIILLCFTVSLNAQSKFSNASKLALTKDPSNALLLTQGAFYSALIQVESNACDSILIGLGVELNARFGNILTARIPIASLKHLESIACIRQIELSSQLNSAFYKNDLERKSTHVDSVQNGLNNGLPKDFSGKGVIVGIVDLGFQCNHPTFYDKTGKHTRITRFWQQNNGVGPSPNGYTYGTEYTDTTLIQTLNDMDGTHGTHVAGIAAGSGFSTPNLQYRGVAPEAELVFVSIKYSNDTLGGSALGDYVVANPNILDAYKYIFDYAASVGKPAVINLSWGMHTGPHDGTSLFDQATELLVGKGKILVGANGNEGDNPMHFLYQSKKDTVSTIMIENGRQFRTTESVYCDFWGSANTGFSAQVEFIDTLNQTVAKSPYIHSSSDSVSIFKWTLDSLDFKVIFACSAKNPDNLKPNITVSADHQNQRKYFMVLHLTSQDSTLVHGWNSGAARSWSSGSFHKSYNQIPANSGFKDGNTNTTAGENGGTSKSVISVGAMAARSAYRNVKGQWVNDSNYAVPPDVVKFSSKGPTVDGRIKPNIVAPGYDVPSSVNNKQFAPWMLDKTLLKTVFQNDTQYWVAFNGTSMSSPHVTGIVALMLEANPNLTAADALDILQTTAIRKQQLFYPNPINGYGQVDAFAAVVKALQLANHLQSIESNGISIYPNPANTTINIEIPENLGFYDLEIYASNGKLVYSATQLKNAVGAKIIDIQDFNSGLYVLKLKTSGEIFTWKLIKN